MMRAMAVCGAVTLTTATAAVISATASAPDGSPVAGFDSAYGSITRADLGRHIEVLASDAFEGREPGTEGERKTVEYLRSAFAAAGAGPGVGGSYFQEVPLLEMRRDGEAAFELIQGTATERLVPNKDLSRSRAGRALL